MLKAPLKVALVGTTPSSKMLAPYNDPSWEIWACSPDNAGGALPRVNRWFEIHGDLGFPGGEPWEEPYMRWLNDQSFDRLYVNELRLDLFRGAQALPKDELVRTFTALFFTSTPAWMVGMAILEGAAELGLYGLDMASREEYRQQRPGFHHMICLAEARGIAVHAPAESDVLQPAPLYGYSLSTPIGRKLEVRRKELMVRLAACDRAINEARDERLQIAGALDDLDYMQSIWTGERGVPNEAVSALKVVKGGHDHG